MVSVSEKLCRCLRCKCRRKKKKPNKIAPEFTGIGPSEIDCTQGGSSTSSSRPRQAPLAPVPVFPSQITVPPTATAIGGPSAVHHANAKAAAVRVSAPGAPNIGPQALASPPDSIPAVVPTKPLRLEDVAEGNYVVGLKRTAASDRWGLIWDAQIMEKRNVRVVEKISPNSIASEWNTQNPGNDISVGDTLIQVNGKSGRLELITIELSRSLEILCEFKPVETRAKTPRLMQSSQSRELEVVPDSPKRTPSAPTVSSDAVKRVQSAPAMGVPTPQKAAPLAPLMPLAPPSTALPRPSALESALPPRPSALESALPKLSNLESALPRPNSGSLAGQTQAPALQAAPHTSGTILPPVSPPRRLEPVVFPPSVRKPEESRRSTAPLETKQKLLEASAIALPEDLMREKPSTLRKMALELGCTEEEIEKSDDAATQEERKTILIQTITQVLSLCSTMSLPEPEPIPTLTSEPTRTTSTVYAEFGLADFADRLHAAGFDDKSKILSLTEGKLRERGFSTEFRANIVAKLELIPESAIARSKAEAPPVVELQADAVTTSEPEEPPPLDQKQEDSEVLYLPKEFRGCLIVRHEGGNIFRVDNSQLDSTGRGVAYRFSKDLEDKSAEFAEWGACLVATDEHDGWIKVSRRTTGSAKVDTA